MSTTTTVGNATDPVTPTATIIAPSSIALCDESPVFLASSANGGEGGRPLQYEWFIDGASAGHASALQPPKQTIAKLVKYDLKVSNWYGQFIYAESHYINYTSNPSVSVSISLPTSMTPLQSELAFGSNTILASSCIPQGFSGSDVSFKFTWGLKNKATGGIINLADFAPGTYKSNRLSISPVSKVTPGFTYIVTLTVDAGLPGLITTVFREFSIPVIPPIARIANNLMETTADVIELDGTVSCDPNLPFPICNGELNGQAESDVSGLKSLTWTCLTSTAAPCFGADGVIPYCQNLGICNFNVTALGPEFALINKPFEIRLTVQSNTTNITATSDAILVDYQPQFELCPYPTITLACARCSSDLVVDSTQEEIKVLALSTFPETWFSSSLNKSQILKFFFVQPNGTLSTISSSRGNQLLLGSKYNQTLNPGTSYTIRAISYQFCGTNFSSQVSAQLTLTTNTPPIGGSISVDVLEGNLTSKFTFLCDGFVDPNTPLSYAVFLKDIGSDSWSQLSPWGESKLIPAILPASATNHRIRCRAKDTYGAISDLDNAPEINGLKVSLPSASEFLRQAQNVGDQIQLLTSSGAPASQVMNMIEAFAQTLQSFDVDDGKRLAAQNSLMTSLLTSTTSLKTGQEVEKQLGTVDKILGNKAIDPSSNEGLILMQGATDIVVNGLANVKPKNKQGKKTTSRRRLQGASSTISNNGVNQANNAQIGQSAGNVASKTLTPFSSSGGGSSRRMLVGTASPDDLELLISNTRKILRDAANVILADIIEGDDPVDLPLGTEMKMVALVVRPDSFGKTLQELSLPAFNDSRDTPSTFYLPTNLLIGATSDVTSPVNVVAVRFRFNVREIAKSGLVNRTLDRDAPSDAVEEVIALDFQRPEDPLSYHPSGLEEPILIKVPLKFEQLPKNSSEKKISCGYWNEIQFRWSSSGCSVSNISLPTSALDSTGFILCACDHASDYAAWQAFIADVTGVFDNPVDLTLLTTIAAVVCGVLLPLAVIIWLGLSRVGRKMDLRDSRMVHLGKFNTTSKVVFHRIFR